MLFERINLVFINNRSSAFVFILHVHFESRIVSIKRRDVADSIKLDDVLFAPTKTKEKLYLYLDTKKKYLKTRMDTSFERISSVPFQQCINRIAKVCQK